MIYRAAVQGQPKQNLQETLSQPIVGMVFHTCPSSNCGNHKVKRSCPGQLGQKAKPVLLITRKKWIGVMAQVVECLPFKHKALQLWES
jgi:hypothetical protein